MWSVVQEWWLLVYDNRGRRTSTAPLQVSRYAKMQSQLGLPRYMSRLLRMCSSPGICAVACSSRMIATDLVLGTGRECKSNVTFIAGAPSDRPLRSDEPRRIIRHLVIGVICKAPGTHMSLDSCGHCLEKPRSSIIVVGCCCASIVRRLGDAFFFSEALSTDCGDTRTVQV